MKFCQESHIGLRDIIKPGVDMWDVKSMFVKYVENNVLPLQIGVDGELMDYLMRRVVD